MSSKKLKEAAGKAGKTLKEGFAEAKAQVEETLRTEAPAEKRAPQAESGDGMHDMPKKCPVSGGPLYVSELTCEESGVVIRGRFRIPEQAGLDEDKQAFLKVFLRARGVISTVEKELGMSYPTVRARLDALLDELGLAPIREDAAKKRRAEERKRQVLKDLEDGTISPDEAKRKLRGIK